MGHVTALSLEDKQFIYTQKIAGKTLATIAEEVGCSYHCARKWWRVGRDGGLDSLREKRKGRGGTGVLSQFSESVRQTALTLKQDHPKWGAIRVRVELLQNETLKGQKIPSISRLAVFFKTHCPKQVAKPKPKIKTPSKPPKATYVHHIWQMDTKEAIYLANSEIASVCSLRDPVSGAVIATDAFSVKTKTRWRKLQIDELRQVIRQGFSRWERLPECIQTDNETRLSGHPSDHFPSVLTLWLVGLGIRHQFSRPGKPTDQAHIERQHRTLDGFTCAQQDRLSLDTLQDALQRELDIYNSLFPARASGCHGHPPLVAYPELLSHTHSTYTLETEPFLFSLERVYRFLADYTFPRKVSAQGQARVGRARYSVGRKYAGRSILVRLDADTKQWCFLDAEDESELSRLDALGLDFETLSGIKKTQIKEPINPIQLPLLFPV